MAGLLQWHLSLWLTKELLTSILVDLYPHDQLAISLECREDDCPSLPAFSHDSKRYRLFNTVENLAEVDGAGEEDPIVFPTPNLTMFTTLVAKRSPRQCACLKKPLQSTTWWDTDITQKNQLEHVVL